MNMTSTQQPGTMIDTPEGIQLYKMCSMYGGLQMEMLGLKSRGRSAYVLIKEQYNLKGSRASVLEQFRVLIMEAKQ